MTLQWGATRTAVEFDHAHAPGPLLVIASSLAESSMPSTPYSPSGGTAQSHDDDPNASRLRGLVDLAKEGDAEAFGQLYDHYVQGVFRFVYYRVGSRPLAEDLTSETFARGLRSIQRFNWQGKDFGAWLTTIARNLVADHFKSSRSRLEVITEVIPESKTTVPSPEDDVLALISNELLYQAVNQLPKEQRDCVLMRFIQGLSIAQTAAALGRSEGAVKQLQLRAIRGLSKIVSEDIR